ncbi:hypothetical protein [Thiosocius teredinicola]|uniref:hypothetical protein n=1 Tax=Thiosocius teredinicola TaxID=1973002 RepID=UPI000F780976
MKFLVIAVSLSLAGVWPAISAPGGRIQSGAIPITNNCSHFLGEWKSETFNPYGNYTNIQTAVYRPNGKLELHITIKNEDGTIQEAPKVVRDWYCDGTVYITRNDPEVEDAGRENGAEFKVYQLLGTSPNLIRYRTVVGHSPGVIFTLERTGN